ncbi:MAG: HAD family phosphatase [Gammaproteobacteria bacterium]
MKIKNIIFDLGGVIIDIDYSRTSEAFRKLGSLNFDAVYTQSKQDNLFDDYDVGKISSDAFRNTLKNKLDIVTTDQEFDTAWNAMLLDLPLERLIFIKELRKNYNVLLYSNTNDIHLKEVFNICQRQNGFSSFEGYFDQEYYSNIFGKRKPNPDSFKAILELNKMDPNETLFLDDSLQHVLGARQAGLHAVHLSKGQSLFDTLKFIKQIESTLVEEEKSTMRFNFGGCVIL